MAGTTVATWVKVKTKSGMTSRPISHKYEGGAGYEPGQVITMSEYQKLKAEGNQKREETKRGGKEAIASPSINSSKITKPLNEWMDGNNSVKFGRLTDGENSIDIHVSHGTGNYQGMLMVKAKSEGKTLTSAPFLLDKTSSVESIRKSIEEYYASTNPKVKLIVGDPPRTRKLTEKSYGYSASKNNKSSAKKQPKINSPGAIKAGNGTLTGSKQNDEFLARYQGKRGLTASQETALRVYEKQASADINKVQIGQGVGYSLTPGKKGAQINRGFRVVDKDPDTKMVKLRQVADTGITVTGGNDRLGDTWVHAAALIPDKKYSKK